MWAWLVDLLPDSSRHHAASSRWLPNVLWTLEPPKYAQTSLPPSSILILARCYAAKEEHSMPSLALHKSPSSPHNGLPFPVSFAFLFQSPGDWHNLLDEEELKGVSMATAGPAPYQSV